jgi:hypothetical protein
MSKTASVCRRSVIIFFVIFTSIHSNIYASFDTKKGARPLGMGGAFVAAANTGDAMYYNPAGLWVINNLQLQAFYSVPFNMTDLATTAFNFTCPTKLGNGTVNFESYGFDLYRETTIGLAYSQSFRHKLVYGLAFNYDFLAIKNGGSAGTLGVDMGILFKPHNNIILGFSSRNVNRPAIAHDKLPQVFSFGISYHILGDLTLNTDLYKDVKFRTDIRVGAEYQLLGKLFLRIGTASDPSRFSAGIGFDFGAGEVDYAMYTHPELGVTHSASVSLYLHRKAPREIKN